MFNDLLVVVRGGGDLASGVVHRLHRAGFPVAVTELPRPLAIRRAVSFASAVFDGAITVESITARQIDTVAQVQTVIGAGEVPVLVDEGSTALAALNPQVVVDARMAKRKLDTTRDDAPLVIALGPGFEAGRGDQCDCHAVVETQRGHFLGRVIWQGTAAPDTKQPGGIQGRLGERVLRAPAPGVVVAQAKIGDILHQEDVIATVAGVPIRAPFDGVLRGLIHPSVAVHKGAKIGDVDPRGVREHCFTISDKALAIGGGVLEAILSAPQFVFWFDETKT